MQGLACDPSGLLYLVRNVNSRIRRFNVDSGSYIPNSPSKSIPFTVPTDQGGAAWTNGSPGMGTSDCKVEANGADERGLMRLLGSPVLADNNVTPRASNPPLNATTDFLTSMTQGFIPMAGGGQGNFCLGGAVGTASVLARSGTPAQPAARTWSSTSPRCRTFGLA